MYVYDDGYKIAFLCSRTPIHETLIHETLGSFAIRGRKLILEFKIPKTRLIERCRTIYRGSLNLDRTVAIEEVSRCVVLAFLE